jgi:hypothetical protein
VAVAKTNRVIRDKEINASAKRFIYGRKEAVRLNAVIEANRFIETANAVTHLYVPDGLGPKNNQAPTIMPWMFFLSIVVSFAYTNNWHCLSTGV